VLKRGRYQKILSELGESPDMDLGLADISQPNDPFYRTNVLAAFFLKDASEASAWQSA